MDPKSHRSPIRISYSRIGISGVRCAECSIMRGRAPTGRQLCSHLPDIVLSWADVRQFAGCPGIRHRRGRSPGVAAGRRGPGQEHHSSGLGPPATCAAKPGLPHGSAGRGFSGPACQCGGLRRLCMTPANASRQCAALVVAGWPCSYRVVERGRRRRVPDSPGRRPQPGAAALILPGWRGLALLQR